MISFRTLLVIGENHKEISEKYSATGKIGDKVVKYKLTEAPKLHIQYLKTLEEILKALQENENAIRRQEQIDEYMSLYKSAQSMDDFMFYSFLTSECDLDDDGNALSFENPDAHYKNEKCYDEQVRKNQDKEAPFSDPLILLNGKKAYSAKVKDVDWGYMHLGKSKIYEAVWELCVEGREPLNDDEKTALNVMGNKKDYFAKFNNKDEYVKHCCAFWCYGVATKKGYEECNGRDVDWTNNFYEKYIKPLKPNDVVTIYEMQLLD